MTNLILGYGKLGKELVSQTQWHYITRSIDGFDFCNIKSYSYLLDDYQTIINTIADTNTYSNNKENHLNVNFKAVCDLTDYCNLTNKKLVQISTDYIYTYSPQYATEESVPSNTPNWYTYSKLLADGYVQIRSKDYLLIRTSFKPKPFPYDKALVRQKGNFDYIDVIGRIIIKLINKNARGIFNVGTEIKTIYDLALQTNPNVNAWFGELDPTMPSDISMNLSKMENFLNE